MNSSQAALYQSFQSAYAHKNQDDSGGTLQVAQLIYIDSFFDEAKHGLLKDLVDFHNRDDFDQYMRSIEKGYYQKGGVAQPPYENLPDYPPKPYQQPKKKSQQHQELKKDFIDKVHEVNQKRLQAYQYPTPEQIQQQQRQQYYQSLNQRSVDQNSIPFFDTLQNKVNPTQSYQQLYPGMLPPQQFPNPQSFPHTPSYMQKFVAGPTRLEANPLSEPSRSFKAMTPTSQIPPLSDYDLKNPDVQYERYKHLMSNQFYNNHANSMSMGIDMTGQHTVYHPPAPFSYVQNQAPQFHPGGNYPPHSVDMYQMSFNPNMRHPGTQNYLNNGPSYGNMAQGGHIFPQTQQMYHNISNSVSLYNQPGGPPPGFVDPRSYRKIKDNNIVDKNIIESIGGIEDTLKPLQETFKQHELRPFQIQSDYKRDYYNSSKGKDLKRSHSDARPDNMKIVSVSPYRAVVKIDRSSSQKDKNLDHSLSSDSSDDEDGKHDLTRHIPKGQFLDNSQNYRNSPIRSDSQSLRGTREHFLNNFNEKRSYGNGMINESYDQRQGDHSQGHVKEQQKIKMESEFLRQQREQFLNSFSQPNQSSGGKNNVQLNLPH